MHHTIVIAVSLLVSMSASAAERIRVPAGTFSMGCSIGDALCESDEGPPGGVPVNVPAFVIDRHEVTVADYRACVESGRCTRPLDSRLNMYCNYDHPERDSHPVNCVDWKQAVDFCAAIGARLPREAEWETAARAGSLTAYPWGDDVSCKQAILDEVSPQPSKQEPDGCWKDASWPVGSRAPNALGLYDMHGNVGEWTANWYAPDAIASLYAKGDLDGPANSRQRVARGGSWDENRVNLRSSFRNTKPPAQGESIYGSIGFRCAADAP